MELGSDIGVPLAGTRLSIWPLPVKSEKKSAQTQVIQVGKQKVAFDDLYMQYYTRVLAYLRFRVGSSEVAEDLVSQVFERALTHLADLQSPGAVGAWLFRIARNCASDYFRRQRPAASLDTLVDSCHPRECSPEETLVAQEDSRLPITNSRRAEPPRMVPGRFVMRPGRQAITRGIGSHGGSSRGGQILRPAWANNP